MASIAVGPGGVNIEGEHNCSNNTFLADQGGPFGALVDMLISQRLTNLQALTYDPIAEEMDRHMPMRASTAENMINTNHYKLQVSYTGLLNTNGLVNVTPAIGSFNNPTPYRDACGSQVIKSIPQTANINSEACNPSIDGPMPVPGRENYGRQGFTSYLPLPPLCMGDWPNKEHFYEYYRATLRAVENGVITRFGVGQHRWMIGRTRYNAAPVQVNQGNGTAKLVESPDLFTAFEFGRVPQHWGSPDWFASMLRYSEVPSRQDVRIGLPTAILQKYKEDFMSRQMGLNLFAQAGNISRDINGYIATLQNEVFVYQDKVTGRKITFEATRTPIYVEVQETGPNIGTWEYQEPWVTRDSETAGFQMQRENPNWGRACSCTGKVLAAIISVSADGAEKPFYKEPFPSSNPDPRMASLFSAYTSRNGIDLKSSLAQIYPSTATTTVFTGLEAQVYVLHELNRRAIAAGAPCNLASNVLNTWVAGFSQLSAVFVEGAPRELANFMLLMPQDNTCVDLAVPCNVPTEVSAAGGVEPLIKPDYKQAVPTPAPVDPPTPPAGTISMVGRITNITAPCEGTKTVRVKFIREGGTAGALSVTLASTPTTHGGTPPTSVSFADGDLEKIVTWTIPAWICPSTTPTTETYDITVSGAAVTPGTFTTRTICITCASNCPTTCEAAQGGCATC